MTVTAREDLAWWIDDELWETEAAGPVITEGNALFVARARLVRRVPAWGEPHWERFVTSCKDEALRVSEGSMRPEETRDLLSIARRVGRHRPALAAYVGALVAASTAAEDDVTTQQRRFAMARSIQSAWLARTLCL